MVPVITPRIAAIKSSKLAKGRPALAHLLAFATHYTIEEVDRILQVAPFERAPATLNVPMPVPDADKSSAVPSDIPKVAFETNPQPRARVAN